MHPFVLVASPECQEDEISRWEDFMDRYDIPFERREESNATDKNSGRSDQESADGTSSCCRVLLTSFIVIAISHYLTLSHYLAIFPTSARYRSNSNSNSNSSNKDD